MSHLGMSFQDSGLVNLLLNKHNGLNVQKTMEMLRLVWFRYYKSCILLKKYDSILIKMNTQKR
jgi:hypothetical protein